MIRGMLLSYSNNQLNLKPLTVSLRLQVIFNNYKSNTSKRGCVRWMTKHHILQHELTTAMQYQLI